MGKESVSDCTSDQDALSSEKMESFVCYCCEKRIRRKEMPLVLQKLRKYYWALPLSAGYTGPEEQTVNVKFMYSVCSEECFTVFLLQERARTGAKAQYGVPPPWRDYYTLLPEST